MQGDEQERFEDYLELERYIEALQAGHVAHPPADLTLSQARVYQMAALFRSLSPDAAEPRPEFAEQLKAQLLAADTSTSAEHDVSDEPTEPMRAVSKPIAPPAAPPLPEPPQTPQSQSARNRKKINFFSRRSLLTSGAVAAASLAVGAATEHLAEQVGKKSQTAASTSTGESYSAVNISADIATTWLPVATLEQLSTTAVRFVTDAMVGYIVRITADADDANKTTGIIALSAACTHKGCIVKWQDSDRLFHCPCHNGLFDASGTFVDISQYGNHLSPLPRLNTKITGNTVYVEVPASRTR